jgi:hypothetical protein
MKLSGGGERHGCAAGTLSGLRRTWQKMNPGKYGGRFYRHRRSFPDRKTAKHSRMLD